MQDQPIRKPDMVRAFANLPDDPATRAGLGWEAARSWLDYLPGGALNIAYETIDRHVAHGQHRYQVALTVHLRADEYG